MKVIVVILAVINLLSLALYLLAKLRVYAIEKCTEWSGKNNIIVARLSLLCIRKRNFEGTTAEYVLMRRAEERYRSLLSKVSVRYFWWELLEKVTRIYLRIMIY